MRTGVAIALVIVGGLLIVAPYVADYTHQALVARLIQGPGSHSVNLASTVSEFYDFGCYLAGGLALVSGIALAWRGGKTQ